MTHYNYINETGPLSGTDISRQFNSYRVIQATYDILVKLNKTGISQYKVLEPGCGSGDKLRAFVEMGARPENCHGLDLSERGIELARYLSPPSMDFQVGDALNIPFEDQTFDIIFASGLFGCFSDDTKVVELGAELHRLLKPDGVLILCDLSHHYADFYRNNEVMMAKGVRGYNGETKELEGLLKGQFLCGGQSAHLCHRCLSGCQPQAHGRGAFSAHRASD